jgi:anti-sigma factor RsiW
MRHCSEEELLSYQDDELSRDEMQRVQRHLGACWNCRNRLAELEEQTRHLAQAEQETTFPGPAWRHDALLRLHRSIAEWESAQPAAPRSGLSARIRRCFRLDFFIVPAHVVYGGIFLCAASILAYLAFPSRIQAHALLLQSVRAERAALRAVKAKHRTWEVEQRISGRVQARRRVELWQGRDSRPMAHRVYDENQRLVQAEWVLDNGARVAYANGRAQAVANFETQPLPRGLDDVAMMDLSAQSFLDFEGSASTQEVQHDSSGYTVRFALSGPQRSGGRPGLVRVRLVLRGAEFRPVEGELLFAGENEEMEYRLRETATESFIDTPPPVSVFAPENYAGPEKETHSVSPSVRSENGAHRANVNAPSVNAPLEVRVLSQLAMANVTLGPDVRLDRQPDGTLELRITAPPGKHDAILADLEPIAHEPGLTITMLAGSDAPHELTGQNPSSHGSAPERQGSAAERAASPEQLLVANAERLRAHALATLEIASRFGNRELATLSDDQNDQWLMSCLQHVRAMESEAISLLHALATVFPGDDDSATENVPEVTPTNFLSSIRTVTRRVQEIRRTTEKMSALQPAPAGDKHSDARRLRRDLKLAIRQMEQIRVAMEPR